MAQNDTDGISKKNNVPLLVRVIITKKCQFSTTNRIVCILANSANVTCWFLHIPNVCVGRVAQSLSDWLWAGQSRIKSQWGRDFPPKVRPGRAANYSPPGTLTFFFLTPPHQNVYRWACKGLCDNAQCYHILYFFPATSMCFAEKQAYTQEVLAVVMQHLMEQNPLPTLLMRTVIQSLSLYPRLIGFVMNILQRLIMKQVTCSS